jgi:predicted transcriptional regulator
MKKLVKPTDSELEILNILWQEGPSAVRTIHEHLGKDSGYTTTLKLMQIMHEKGLLRRNAEAKVHIYEAAVSQEQTQGQMLRRMIDTVFNGSAANLVMQAIGNHTASNAEIAQIREYLDEVMASHKKGSK